MTAVTQQLAIDGIYIYIFTYIVTVKISWDDDDNGDEVDTPSFPGLVEAIEKSISQLGGAVFPKLNWSSPRVMF